MMADEEKNETPEAEEPQAEEPQAEEPQADESRAEEPQAAEAAEAAPADQPAEEDPAEAPGGGRFGQARQDDHRPHRRHAAPSALREDRALLDHPARPRREKRGARGRHRPPGREPPALSHQALAARRGAGAGAMIQTETR